MYERKYCLLRQIKVFLFFKTLLAIVKYFKVLKTSFRVKLTPTKETDGSIQNTVLSNTQRSGGLLVKEHFNFN